jgi:hypothetical protein
MKNELDSYLISSLSKNGVVARTGVVANMTTDSFDFVFYLHFLFFIHVSR